MRAHTSVAFALVSFALGALPAMAQDAKLVEVTPYVGVGSAAASPVGTAVTFPVTSTLGVETDVAYRRGEGDIHALSSSVSLLYSLPRIGQSTPYVAGGVGLSQYGAPVFSFDGPPIGTAVARGPDSERGRRPEDAREREVGFANRCPVVQVLWPSGIGAVSRGSRSLLRCRQAVEVLFRKAARRMTESRPTTIRTRRPRNAFAALACPSR